ncbi:hypothetical protein [Roseospira visakhapatnamensis]|uniref:Uncharacterized protein n=1 Tax=Roseospira visakhapatnamensis TaxID=390880 RepID=A0A7W6RF97_9PROT|nr:hypothetical protein [Roseospira visakhapatnamensis]MBB4266954.1 hypothetical protein [Roseospira visakhapatnamensis]
MDLNTIPTLWLRVHGPVQARAARDVWPRAAGPLPVTGPRGAVESLGPGWPRAVRDALADVPGGASAAVPMMLAVDCGAAVGLALAVLDDWGPAHPAGMHLVLALAESVPAAVRAAVAARAEAWGVAVISAASLRSLDVGPDASADRVADEARALARARLE